MSSKKRKKAQQPDSSALDAETIERFNRSVELLSKLQTHPAAVEARKPTDPGEPGQIKQQEIAELEGVTKAGSTVDAPLTKPEDLSLSQLGGGVSPAVSVEISKAKDSMLKWVLGLALAVLFGVWQLTSAQIDSAKHELLDAVRDSRTGIHRELDDMKNITRDHESRLRGLEAADR